jgi:hypothetical protein
MYQNTLFTGYGGLGLKTGDMSRDREGNVSKYAIHRGMVDLGLKTIGQKNFLGLGLKTWVGF